MTFGKSSFLLHCLNYENFDLCLVENRANQCCIINVTKGNQKFICSIRGAITICNPNCDPFVLLMFVVLFIFSLFKNNLANV